MKSSELIRLLERDRWYVVRQSGSHLIMRHPIKLGQLTVPVHGSAEVGKGLEKKIMKNAGLK